MKKIAFLLSFIILLSTVLVGCNNSTTSSNNPTHKNEQTTNKNGTADNNKGESGVFTPTITTKVTYEDVINAEPSPKTDFLYNELENGIEIYHYKGNSEIIVVPILINGKKVTTILRSAFKSAHSAQAIVLPATITTLDGTFEKLPNLKIVICDGVKKCINKPFDNTENVTIYCKRGSFMHNYTKSRKINFELVEEPTTEATTTLTTQQP